ncbi:MAG: glycoside hydrolase family 3 N-terminal domain-containing protein [Sphingobacteriales bacterium]
MKRIVLIAAILFCATYTNAQRKTAESDIDKKVDALLAKMTIDEKIGQMTQLTLDVVLQSNNGKATEPTQIDADKIKEALQKYHVGSILNISGAAYTREHWHKIISDIQNAAAQTRLKIPVLYGIDAMHGQNYVQGSTLFPQEIGMAATFNPELAKREGAITAYETRASYIPWDFSPVLDLGRNPLWPRIYETFGEDPYLAKTMGAAVVRGYQGNDPANKYNVASCMKHYLGYSFPLDGKDRTPAWMPDRYMREYFLPSFRASVNAGAMSVMVNSSEINGVPVHSSHYLLTDVLRGELGFKGVIVTDWMDIKYLHDRHHIAATQKDAVLIAINAGIDMSMVPLDYTFYDLLNQLVKEGKVPVSRINESVRRILTMKYKLGIFEHPIGNPDDYPKFGSPEFAAVSLKSAVESITLLKNNNNVLPLKKDMKVLVTGPAANSMRALNGGWSYTWQGDVTNQFTTDKNTILKAIEQKIGKDNVEFEPGSNYDSPVDIDAAVKAAKKSDVIVLCLGENSYAENPGNIDDLDLPSAQIDLANALMATGKPVILVMTEGRPRIITDIEGKSAATIMAYLPSNEGGNALTDILFGDANPSGRLPYTYPRHANALVNYYRKNIENGNGDDAHGYNPLYEFGYGLSYTNFSYSNLHISKPTLKEGETLTVTVDVKNTGDREGKESVLLYSREEYASITPDTKRLRAFDKIDLKPGETQTVTFKLTSKDLAFINDVSKSVTEAGEFKVMIGRLEQSFNYITNAAPSRTGKL